MTNKTAAQQDTPFAEHSAGDNGDHDIMRSSSSSCSGSTGNSTPIYYFGYGPMVHPMVRHRRGVSVVKEQAAVLRNHRLTFAFGGVASVVPQRGYDVHGIVMQCKTRADWVKLQAAEGGFYPVDVQVVPYDAHQYDAGGDESAMPVLDLGGASPEEDSEDDDQGMTKQPAPIQARVFVMLEFDESKLEQKLERLPQERYLRLIATGMAKYHGDEDYIADQIMGVAFKPSRKPGNYATFPVLQLPLADARSISCNNSSKYPSTTETDSASFAALDTGSNHTSNNNNTESQSYYTLPKITMQGYQRFCQSLPDKMPDEDNLSSRASSTHSISTDAYPTHLLFIVGTHVVMIHNHPGPTHPGAMWFQRNAHAKPEGDVTFYLHQTHVDPDVAYCDTQQDVTPEHQAWAENLLVESIAQGLAVYRVFAVVDDDNDRVADSTSSQDEASVQRLQAFLKANNDYGNSSNSMTTSTATPEVVTTTSTEKGGKKPRRRSTLSKLTSKIKKEFKLAAAAATGSGSGSHNGSSSNNNKNSNTK